jgi:hypothetical protein
MQERRISEEQVARTLNRPHRVYAGRNDRIVAERDTERGNILRVVYIESTEGSQVVSALVVTAVRMAAKGTRT